MAALKQEVRRFIAWRSIKDDSEDLNLDAAQNRETDNNLKRSNDTVDLRIKETYCWLLVPYIDRNVDMKGILWDCTRISGGSEGLVSKAAKKMAQSETLIAKWAPALLRMELDNLLWRDNDSIAIKTLWEYLCTYCYLPRLAGYDVLEDAIRTGVNSSEYFGLASAIGEDRFIDLKYNQYVGIIERSAHLVKTTAAQKQIEAERAAQPAPQPDATKTSSVDGGTSSSMPGSVVQPQPDADPQQTKNTRFYMSAQLDTTRMNRDVQRLVEEVISHLSSVDGAQMEVSLEVSVTAPGGLSSQVVRTVSENCRTLKVKDFGFDS